MLTFRMIPVLFGIFTVAGCGKYASNDRSTNEYVSLNAALELAPGLALADATVSASVEIYLKGDPNARVIPLGEAISLATYEEIETVWLQQFSADGVESVSKTNPIAWRANPGTIGGFGAIALAGLEHASFSLDAFDPKIARHAGQALTLKFRVTRTVDDQNCGPFGPGCEITYSSGQVTTDTEFHAASLPVVTGWVDSVIENAETLSVTYTLQCDCTITHKIDGMYDGNRATFYEEVAKNRLGPGRTYLWLDGLEATSYASDGTWAKIRYNSLLNFQATTN